MPKPFDPVQFGRDIADQVAKMLKATTGPLSARVTALEAAAAAAMDRDKAGPSLRYLGVWKDRMHCRSGDMVTFRGQLWYCSEDTEQVPGTDGWRLMQKKEKL